MMKNKKPEIRFKGFSEDWTERELDTVFHKIRNAFVGVATPYYVSEGHFYLESNNVKDGQINRNNEIFINDEFYEKQKNNWLHTGDIAMVQSGHVGHSAVIPPELNNTAAHALIIFAEPKEKINSYFLNYQFQTTQTKKGLRDITTCNTIKHILSSEMKRFNVFMSEYEEQTQIGNFFKNLDSLITLHQRKYEKLGILKKAMLEKMFPKNGMDVPEIRFKGFEGAWEERTLGNLFGIASASRVHKHEWTESGVPFFRSSDVVSDYKGQENNKAFISFELYEELAKKSGSVQKNDILVTGGGSIGIPYLVKSNEPLYFKDADLLWLKNSDNMNGYFLYTFFSTSVFRNYVNSNTHIGTISHYTIEQAKATPIKVPKREEQDKIGVYLTNLDNLLTLHQGELGKLKNLKKAMLEKMFV